ncbi:MAG: PrsW family glutamic-type intramembrane protease [Propionibacteriaceae bacterium]
MRSPDLARRKHFAVKPDEPVASFALISTIMPRGAGERPQTYRIALTLALTVALVAAIFGAMPIAVLVAAFAIPIVYIVYLYDVNLWEDEPVPVTAMAFALTGVLALGFTIVWTMIRGSQFRVGDLIEGTGMGGDGPQVGTFLLVGIAVPIIGELIRQIGPLFLASRPQFDDLMDGLTFGVISGVSYATFDTIVKHWDLLTGGMVGQTQPGLWVSLIFLEGFVKPLVFGTATGIACAEFSGLGEGYDGFSGRYFRGLAVAIGANIAYQSGTYFFSFLAQPTLAVILSVIWGVLILGVLILLIRNILHVGLMEAALERSAREAGVGEDGDLKFCGSCEMPLLMGAAFCNACGTASRTQSKAHKERPARTGANVGTTTPGSGEAPAAEAGGGTATAVTTEAPEQASEADVPPSQAEVVDDSTRSPAPGDATEQPGTDEEGRA